MQSYTSNNYSDKWSRKFEELILLHIYINKSLLQSDITMQHVELWEIGIYFLYTK